MVRGNRITVDEGTLQSRTLEVQIDRNGRLFVSTTVHKRMELINVTINEAYWDTQMTDILDRKVYASMRWEKVSNLPPTVPVAPMGQGPVGPNVGPYQNPNVGPYQIPPKFGKGGKFGK